MIYVDKNCQIIELEKDCHKVLGYLNAFLNK